MDSRAVPAIRLTVESMKHSILHHMGLRGSELGALVEKQIDEAVASYPWESEVKEIVHKAITDAIEAFFKYGEGGMAVRDSVRSAINTSLGLPNDE